MHQGSDLELWACAGTKKSARITRALNPSSFAKPIPFLGDPSKRGQNHNFGPRFGFAWNVFGTAEMSSAAAAGIYYNNIQTLLNFPENRNLSQCSVLIRNPTYPDPYGGKSPTAFCSTAAPTVTVLDQNFQMPYSEQFTLGYSRQITQGLSRFMWTAYTRIRCTIGAFSIRTIPTAPACGRFRRGRASWTTNPFRNRSTTRSMSGRRSALPSGISSWCPIRWLRRATTTPRRRSQLRPTTIWTGARRSIDRRHAAGGQRSVICPAKSRWARSGNPFRAALQRALGHPGRRRQPPVCAGHLPQSGQSQSLAERR